MVTPSAAAGSKQQRPHVWTRQQPARMNANANASFFGNLRGSSKEPAAKGAPGSRGGKSAVPVYEDKVRVCCVWRRCASPPPGGTRVSPPHCLLRTPAEKCCPRPRLTLPSSSAPGRAQENTANASSRLRRPRTAAAILQNKSTELNTGKHDATVAAIYKAEDEKQAEAFEADPDAGHPLCQEFKQSEINFQQLLDTKISTKGQALSDLKKRSEESKGLIISLRKAVSELLGKRDAVITRAISIDSTAKDAAEKSAARIAQLEADVSQSQAAMEATKKEVSELAQRYAELEAQLTACDASKAAALARSYELEKELASEKGSRESTAAMLAVREKELADSKACAQELARKLEHQQMGFDKARV